LTWGRLTTPGEFFRGQTWGIKLGVGGGGGSFGMQAGEVFGKLVMGGNGEKQKGNKKEVYKKLET